MSKVREAAYAQVKAWGLSMLHVEDKETHVDVYCALPEAEETWAIRLQVETLGELDLKFSAQPMMKFDGWMWTQHLMAPNEKRVGALQLWSDNPHRREYHRTACDPLFIDAIKHTYQHNLECHKRRAEGKLTFLAFKHALQADDKGHFTLAPDVEGRIITDWKGDAVVNLSISTRNLEKIQQIMDLFSS